MPWGPPSACTTWWLILLLTFSTTTPKLLVIPAVPGIDGDDLHVVSVENTTVVVYTPASIQLSPGTTFAPLGSFVSIAHPARKEDLLTAALDAAAAPPRLVSNTSEDDLRHPVAFDLLFVHPASQLHIWRPQPLEDRWFPMGDVVTMGSSAPDPMRVWLIASQCLGEFAGYAPLALDAHQTTCTTVTIGDMGVLEARGMTMVRACEAHGNQLGALGTVWLGKREPCGHVVPVFCPMPSCMAVPGRSSWGDTSGMPVFACFCCCGLYMYIASMCASMRLLNTPLAMITVDRWCIHGVHRFVRLCQPLVEGTHAALAAAGGSLTQGTLGTLNVKQGGMVLRRELSNRLRGCFMVAHQLFSVRYRKVGGCVVGLCMVGGVQGKGMCAVHVRGCQA